MIGRPLSAPARELERRTNRVLLAETLRSLPSVGDALTLTLPQLRTLLALPTSGAETIRSLGENLKLRESRIARVCTLLVARGLVVRVPGTSTDGEVLIGLSSAGRRFVDDLIYDPALEGVVERGPTGNRVLSSTCSTRSTGWPQQQTDTDPASSRRSGGTMKPYELPDLAYDYSALEPHYSARFSSCTTTNTTRPTSTVSTRPSRSSPALARRTISARSSASKRRVL
jgi:DNA-binding MarR family transcriptional regulator